MTYIAFALDDQERSVVPVAQAGDHGYLARLQLSWSEHAPHGRGPAGRTIRSGAASFVNDILNDQGFSLWRERAANQGFRAVITLPLREHERSFGVLALYSDKVLTVSDEEIKLLQQMADDVAFGIDNLRVQAAQRLVQPHPRAGITARPSAGCHSRVRGRPAGTLLEQGC